MSNFAICYAKISKKFRFCRIKQKNVELIVRFDINFVTVFVWLRFFYTQIQEKGGIQC